MMMPLIDTYIFTLLVLGRLKGALMKLTTTKKNSKTQNNDLQVGGGGCEHEACEGAASLPISGFPEPQ